MTMTLGTDHVISQNHCTKGTEETNFYSTNYDSAQLSCTNCAWCEVNTPL